MCQALQQTAAVMRPLTSAAASRAAWLATGRRHGALWSDHSCACKPPGLQAKVRLHQHGLEKPYPRQLPQKRLAEVMRCQVLSLPGVKRYGSCARKRYEL